MKSVKKPNVVKQNAIHLHRMSEHYKSIYPPYSSYLVHKAQMNFPQYLSGPRTFNKTRNCMKCLAPWPLKVEEKNMTEDIISASTDHSTNKHLPKKCLSCHQTTMFAIDNTMPFISSSNSTKIQTGTQKTSPDSSIGLTTPSGAVDSLSSFTKSTSKSLPVKQRKKHSPGASKKLVGGKLSRLEKMLAKSDEEKSRLSSSILSL